MKVCACLFWGICYPLPEDKETNYPETAQEHKIHPQYNTVKTDLFTDKNSFFANQVTFEIFSFGIC